MIVLRESGIGNREPLKDVLAEKGLHIVDDPAVVEKRLRDLGHEHLVGTVPALILMLDTEEGEVSVWALSTPNPRMTDTISRIR